MKLSWEKKMSLSTLFRPVAFILLLLLSSCAGQPQKLINQESLLYIAQNDTELLDRLSPVFLVEEPDKDFNRIGKPYATLKDGAEVVGVSPEEPMIYTSIRKFSTKKGQYTNFLYRVHFSGIPFHIVPFYLSAGKNVGLIVVVTVDEDQNPLLYTLVHSCGCYLAFVPTSHLPREMLPKAWEGDRQNVFGENLPTFVQFQEDVRERLAVHLRNGSHRVKNVWLIAQEELGKYRIEQAQMKPFLSLEYLELPDGRMTSFFEETGDRKDYVKGSQKIWERILVSWWAFDWRVGEDKKLGRDTNDGILFYTSIKFWAREESDMRDFARFLRYWGWRL